MAITVSEEHLREVEEERDYFKRLSDAAGKVISRSVNNFVCVKEIETYQNIIKRSAEYEEYQSILKERVK
jgi:hypothetical protein